MPEHDLELLKEAALAAGEIAGRYFRAAPESWDKGSGQGPVTEADLAIDRMLRDALLAARPGYGWLSEETEDGPARIGRNRVFIIDPIDGTRAFISGDKAFSHSLAVAEDGRITSAVVFLPMQDRMFTARRGGGAFLNGRPLVKGDAPDISQARVLAAKSQLAPALWPGGVPPFDRHFRPSMAARLCFAAEGSFDAMLTLRPAWEWDVAAGDLICREAGLRVTTGDLRDPRYNNAEPRVNGLIAALPGLHDQIAGLLRSSDAA